MDRFVFVVVPLFFFFVHTLTLIVAKFFSGRFHSSFVRVTDRYGSRRSIDTRSIPCKHVANAIGVEGGACRKRRATASIRCIRGEKALFICDQPLLVSPREPAWLMNVVAEIVRTFQRLHRRYMYDDPEESDNLPTKSIARITIGIHRAPFPREYVRLLLYNYGTVTLNIRVFRIFSRVRRTTILRGFPSGVCLVFALRRNFGKECHRRTRVLDVVASTDIFAGLKQRTG